jgi:hypothetical protein
LQTKEDLGLYSANKQQANRFYKVIKKGKKYPLSIFRYLSVRSKNFTILQKMLSKRETEDTTIVYLC